MRDVLAKVCSRMGSPSAEEKSLLASALQKCLPPRARKGQFFSQAMRSQASIPAAGVDLVQKLLQWIPRSRLTVTAAAAHPYIHGTDVEERGEVEEPAARSATERNTQEGNLQISRAQPAAPTGPAPTGCTRPSCHAGHLCESQGDKGDKGEWVTCACSGHCMQPGHRYARGCSARVWVPSSHAGEASGKKVRVYCVLCKCFVRRCNHPRYGRAACSGHFNDVKSLGPVMRAVWDLRDVCRELIPCDLTILDAVWAKICDDAVFYTFVFMIKEPTPILQFVHLISGLKESYSADDLLKTVLEPLAAFMDGRLVRIEHDNLDGQGPLTIVGRYYSMVA